MIISTSGSSAGIGFAVPADYLKWSADKIVELDKDRQTKRLGKMGRGWLGVEVATSSLEESLKQRLTGSSAKNADDEGATTGAFVTSIAADSPLLQSQDDESAATDSMRTIETTSINNGNIHLGDRIINVGGNSIANGKEFVVEMKKRVEGEQLSLTVENVESEKRVVYVVLGKVPL